MSLTDFPTGVPGSVDLLFGWRLLDSRFPHFSPGLTGSLFQDVPEELGPDSVCREVADVSAVFFGFGLLTGVFLDCFASGVLVGDAGPEHPSCKFSRGSS